MYISHKELPEGILEFNELMCGCGQPILCWSALLEYLTKVVSEDFYHSTGNKFELFFMYVVDSLKLTDHGSSIYGAWITRKGREALEWLANNIDEVDDMIVTYN